MYSYGPEIIFCLELLLNKSLQIEKNLFALEYLYF